MEPETLAALHEARAAEKEQSVFYRALAAQAEDAGDADLAERLNGLHADEQHHLSRLTARLIELGEPLPDLGAVAAPPTSLRRWEADVRSREALEAERYATLLDRPLDPATRTLIGEIRRVEELHERTLSGKWVSA